MKLILRLSVLFLASVSASIMAVEGYEDIYLDREQPVNIHSIFCGANFDNINALKAAYIYTNSEFIEKGTYHFTSSFGNFSYTFNTFGDKDPHQLMSRGTLTNGQTQKSQMKKEACIVGKIPGLPNKLLKNIGKKTLTVDDPEWNQTMAKYGMFGKPAFGKGVYKDQRTASQHDGHDQKVFDANQAYQKALEKQFAKAYKKITRKLPKQLKDAVKYAHQEDGFLASKVYREVKEPSVWTPTSKERYNDQSRKLAHEKSWDIVIQKNFDWLFALTGKDNKLKKTKVEAVSSPNWVGQTLEQKVTVSGIYADGKTLALDFIVKSGKADRSIFDSLEDIKKESHLMRNSPIARSKKPREPVAAPKKASLEVYTPTEKVNIFFSQFREKALGDGYRWN